MANVTYDMIVRSGLWFDGTGAPARRRHVGIRDGVVAAVSGDPLDETGCPEIIEATGKWVVPGFLDIHTHYDAEVLLDPGLRESVRHGMTTVVIGNCSLSSVYADSEDAADLFSRVEAVPREFVIDAMEAKRTWQTSAEYVAALDELPLGPNVSSMLGHSDLRAAVMGLDRATTAGVTPSAAEMDRMAELLNDALKAGLLGLSGMDAPIDKLDGDRYRSRALPSTFATWQERRRLISVLRENDRILQSAPNVLHPMEGLKFFFSSAAIPGWRRAVRMSLLVSADAKATPGAARILGLVTRLANRAIGAKVRFQHLPVPFELYSDGIDLPVFEEYRAGTEALHLRDQIQRNELLGDAEYRARFREALERKRGPSLWHRDFHEAVIVECPDDSLVGRSFGQIADERGMHPLDAFLDVLVDNGERNVRWTTTVANHRTKQLDQLAADPSIHMGFSDAGAHLRNMAFYNFPLRLLKRVIDAEPAGRPFLSPERAVHRLTGELADWFGLEAGTLRVGDRADLAVINPVALDETLDAYHEEKVPFFGGLSRMVNRNDEAVEITAVNGVVVYRSGVFAEGYATTLRAGRFLRAKAGGLPARPAPAAVV